MLRPAMGVVVEGLTTKSDKIRALDKAGYTRAEIAGYLGILYQHVRNVLVANQAKRGQVAEVTVAGGGRATTRVVATPLSADFLIEHGFAAVSGWSIDGEGIKLDTPVPTHAAVYAFAVDGQIHYLGVAGKSLRTRMAQYVRSPASQTTNTRLRPLIREALVAGKVVEILIAAPEDSEWNGLPVIQLAGLELGLIRRFKPVWNVQGTSLSDITVDEV